ncbi:membrane dipeptidase [Hallella faecis]|uniref:Membrane dipeptidase n=1 Tax=Hallella faecis TaxID=2841596 RepID=A0ABV1FP67_9BACT|nr:MULTISPECIES: membrane dipeptidase [Hallella]MBU0289415.1 membrane dipeptidase [Hallella faecis]MDY5926126.1 membrane dipeptidase [Hallella sp.]
METFHIESHLREVYATYPESGHRPVIGITANYVDGDATLRDRYYSQVVRAGGIPVIIPPVDDKDVIVNTLDHIDALLLTGGGDHNPLWFGQEPSPLLHSINATRDLPELLITRLAFNRQIPMLGICRGLQTLALALGGGVAQDISELEHEAVPSEATEGTVGEAGAALAQRGVVRTIKHSQDADRSLATHSVSLSPQSMLASIYATDGKEPNTLCVNSFHHQAVSHGGPRFKATAWAPDGVIEALESTEMKPILGVQWHPEWLGDDGLPLFRWLVEQANLFWKAKKVHERTLTLDTHCDTPMFFPQGVQFGQRDDRILYDLHKMTDGRQDAVIMAAYLPQPKMGEQFSQKVDIAGIIRHNPELASLGTQLSPAQYADMIFDKLEHIVAHYSDYISIARTPADLYEDKRMGRHSIMFGIENGLALNHDLAYVRHFAQRGVVYITLCHNGDNDICDSARGCNTHNGVSSFGEKVIRRMNEEGIMVDLSHAAEKSFYDALDISSTPIVCSHSNSRALCDVPRNLTDDQMRALAQKGGVAHITLYHGFLRADTPEATILDAIDHLEHAIQVMGIDHVGIGTDFDGDGTVRGCADASELINFTRHLLKRRYSERDIAKIWGGNWLRVMAQVQAAKNM